VNPSKGELPSPAGGGECVHIGGDVPGFGWEKSFVAKEEKSFNRMSVTALSKPKTKGTLDSERIPQTSEKPLGRQNLGRIKVREKTSLLRRFRSKA